MQFGKCHLNLKPFSILIQSSLVGLAMTSGCKTVHVALQVSLIISCTVFFPNLKHADNPVYESPVAKKLQIEIFLHINCTPHRDIVFASAQ